MHIMAKAPKQTESGREEKNVSVFQTRLPADLHKAALDFCDAFKKEHKLKPGLNDFVVMAIEQFLEEKGFWPPAKSDAKP